MKSIYLIRHAKASFGILGFSDLNRPLDNIGHIEAINMSKYFAENINNSNNLFVSSPAYRAITTAKYFINALKLADENIEVCKDLYLPSIQQIWRIIQSLDNQISNSVCFFSHNIGISDFASSILNSSTNFYEIPTCGIVKITFDTKTWAGCNENNSRIENYWFPSLVLGNVLNYTFS